MKDKLIKKDYIVLSISFLVGLIIDIIYIKELYIWISLIFILLIILLLILTKNKSIKYEKILFLIIIIEVLFNAKLSFYTYNDLPSDKYSSYDSLLELDSFNSFDQSYRVMTDYTYTDYYSDIFILGHNSSLRYFSSIINGNIIKFFYRTSLLKEKSNYLISAYDSPVLLSLLGNKYFYLLEDDGLDIYNKKDEYSINSYNYDAKKNKNKKIYLYENPYALSLGYVINKDVKYNDSNDIIDYQNNIIKSFTGSDKTIIKKLEVEEIKNDQYCEATGNNNCKKYYIDNNTDNKYIFFFTPTYMFATNEDIKTFGNYNKPFVIKDEDNDNEVYLMLNNKKDSKYVRAAVYDKTNLKECLKILQDNMLTNIRINKNVMEGQINSNKDGILFLSIPYDLKFNIYIDGKVVKHYPLLDNTFMGVDIKKGKHKIKIVYKDNNIKWYIILSLLSLILTIIIYKYNKNKEYI